MSPPSARLILGIDVGSTTVKMVVVDASSRQILWSDYQRHETRQAGKTLELLKAAEASLPAIAGSETRIALTGSVAKPLMRPLGASFVHEMNAVTLAVEHFIPMLAVSSNSGVGMPRSSCSSHLVVAVKPFGCMPSSSVSDGVQSAVLSRHPEAAFCAVETMGDGDVNFQSRVQMYLFKARQKTRAEFDRALAEHCLTRGEARDRYDRRRRSSLDQPGTSSPGRPPISCMSFDEVSAWRACVRAGDRCDRRASSGQPA